MRLGGGDTTTQWNNDKCDANNAVAWTSVQMQFKTMRESYELRGETMTGSSCGGEVRP